MYGLNLGSRMQCVVGQGVFRGSLGVIGWLAAALPLFGCEVIHGSGHLLEERRRISPFDRVVVEGEGQVQFEQANEPKLTIEAEDNIVPALVTKVEDGALVLSVREGTLLDPTLPIRFNVEGPELIQVVIQGSADFQCDTLNGDRLNVTVEGSGDVRFDTLEADALEIDIEGSGDVAIAAFDGEGAASEIAGSGSVSMAGEAEAQSIAISGSGSYHALELQTEDATVDIAGTGDVEVFADQTLAVTIDGSGDVRFKGSPAVTSSASGSGSVKHLD